MLVTLLLCGPFVGATNVPVVLSGYPKLQFFDNSGRPLAFGCLFSYYSGSTTPLTTYTDFTGSVANTNPIILDSAGRVGSTGSSSLFLAAGQAYTLKLVTAGGTNCALGTTIFTIDGIGGGLTLLTTVISCSGTCALPILSENQLFRITLTGNVTANTLTAVGVLPPAWVGFEITQDSAGGHTFTWPANLTGGATVGSNANQVTTQFFVWNGSLAEALGPGVIGTGPALSAGSLLLSGQLLSTLTTGTPPFVVASTTEVSNLNVNFLEGFDWPTPGTIGSSTPNTGVFTTLKANTSFILNGSAAQTAVQGTPDTKLLAASTVAASAPNLCTDANGGATTSCTGLGPNFAPQRVALSVPVGMTANTQVLILTESVTFPAAPGTYRADARYGLFLTVGPNACVAEVIDTTNSRAFALSGQDSNGTGYLALSGAEISSATYAASATATFTLQAICDNGAGGLVGATVHSGLFSLSPAEATYLAVTPILSN